MRLTIGPDIEKPQLSALIKPGALAELHERGPFNQFYESVLTEESIVVAEADNGTTFTLDTECAVRCEEKTGQPRSLEPFARLLEWGCIAGGYEPGSLYRLLDLESRRAFDGYYPVESEGMWPASEDKIVSELVTQSMQNFGRQLKYGSYKDRKAYDQEVYGFLATAEIHSGSTATLLRTILINTADYPAGKINERRLSDAKGYYFRIDGYCISSHKELLTHLVGVIAVTHSDELVTS
ncbi:hypothetical protein H7Y63_03620 [Polaromonas sp.]|nr:hypothetical protein [Candidatus Saccharibacteria bacterium]